MKQLTVPDWLETHAAHRGDVVALADLEAEYSYTELLQAVHAATGGLAARGVEPGDRVITAMEPSSAHVAAFLAALRRGAVPSPLNVRLTAREAKEYLAPLEPRVVLADRSHVELAGALGPDVVLLPEADEPRPLRERLGPLCGPSPSPAELREDAPAAIFGTGGTTGLPKGAVSTHRSLWLWLSSGVSWQGRRLGEVELFYSPFFHVSLVTGLLTTLFVGGTVRVLPRFDAGLAIEQMRRGVTMMMGAPTTFVAVANHAEFERAPRDRVQDVYFGSTAPTPQFVRSLIEQYPNATLRSGYGATEFGPVVRRLHEDILAGRDGTGRPLPGTRIRIHDEEGRPVPEGEIGEIVVQSPWQTIGYWGLPEETRRSYTPEGIRSGDLGVFDGDWLTIVGRSKEMIITGGENVFPAEIESSLAQHPAVSELAVYGVPDAHWGERVEALVVARKDQELTQEGLLRFGRERLAGYKLPKRVRLVDALPLTPNNKPDRQAMRAAALRDEA